MEARYLAGLFESRVRFLRPESYVQIGVDVFHTSKDILVDARKHVGCSRGTVNLYNQNPNRPLYVTSFLGEDAAKLLDMIIPYLRDENMRQMCGELLMRYNAELADNDKAAADHRAEARRIWERCFRP